MKISSVFTRQAAQGTVLLLTLMMLVLLTFEVAIISLVAQRGLGEEGMLASQNIAARRGSEVVLNELEESLRTYINANGTDNVVTDFAYGSTNDIDEAAMAIRNPSSGSTENTDVKISAWLEERRGAWYHLIGRARNGTVDLLKHRWVWVNPCQTGTGGLYTIMTGAQDFGHNGSMAVSSSGRVYFSASLSQQADAFYTWTQAAGLSTIIGQGSTYRLGLSGTQVGSDGRVFFSGQQRVFSWKEGVGLSTLLSTNESQPGVASLLIGNDDRIFFGENQSGTGTVWTWKEDTGLTTIITTGDTPARHSASILKTTSRYYFADEDGNATDRAWSWQAATGLSTIVSNLKQPMYAQPHEVAPDGRVVFGSFEACAGNCPLLTWKPGVGLSTIMDNTFGSPMANQTVGTITSDSRFFIGTYKSGVAGAVYTWKEGTGLTTIATFGSSTAPMQYIGDGDGMGRVYFTRDLNDSRFFTYHVSTGLSTILSGVSGLGYYTGRQYDDDFTESRYVSKSGRVFIAQKASGGKVWTWTPSTGLSTIPISGYNPGVYGGIAIAENDRAYIASDGDGATAQVWSWDVNTGLSTLIDGGHDFIADDGAMITGPHNEVYIGTGYNSVNDAFRAWLPPVDCTTLGY